MRERSGAIDPMARALELAERALGWSSPNPAVGAVVVREGRIVGEGATQPPGGPHAEVVALQAAGEAARGASLYVTLEPCCHYGRTPPCTSAIIAAGIQEVHVAIRDPSPWVDGGGRQALETAGIAVIMGEREPEARQLNEAYFKWVRTGLPFVTLKYAMTADGKIATRTGSSRWISGPEARARVARLRSQVDAILVGVGTVLADDPQLTARPEEFGADPSDPVHQPLRVVLDSQARTPPSAKIVADGAHRTLVCVTSQADAGRTRVLSERGVRIVEAPSRLGRVDAAKVLERLGQQGVTSVLVEGGSAVAASLLEQGLVDKALVFIAPKLVGGTSAPGPVGGLGVERMSSALELRDPQWQALGRDALLTGYVAGPLAAAALED